jgi:hypothetical protein
MPQKYDPPGCSAYRGKNGIQQGIGNREDKKKNFGGIVFHAGRRFTFFILYRLENHNAAIIQIVYQSRINPAKAGLMAITVGEQRNFF